MVSVIQRSAARTATCRGGAARVSGTRFGLLEKAGLVIEDGVVADGHVRLRDQPLLLNADRCAARQCHHQDGEAAEHELSPDRQSRGCVGIRDCHSLYDVARAGLFLTK